MRTRQWIAILGVILTTMVLAFPLRGVVHEIIIVPITYLVWALYLLYRITPQLVWWLLVFVMVVLAILNSLIPENVAPRKILQTIRAPQGPVENLASWMKKARAGVYFKWLVANRLGKLANQMLAQRDTHQPRSVFDPLNSRDLTLPEPVQDYLEAGLHGSFADFPQASTLLAPSTTPTPLDHDITEAVAFLETQIESSRRKIK